ncbi:lysis protein [Pseudomonas sp. MAP12]|uniref:Lysis protein n=1 Tax=Geopseudomonas aromaticivorans TaxID=2849492 RepID=A0ABS6MVC5_9GAMM|nr:lysis system i-spanin subunit Rz [Pseudomonas aromaticivorans]MBV2132742.1 lysis protein [Pseudomonas aromaticivorans]
MIGICIGWVINGWRMGVELSDLRADHAQQLERIAAAQAAAIGEQQQIRDRLMQQLAAIDQQRYQELTHAQENADRLAADLAAARQRLRVRIDPASCSGMPDTTGAAGLDDGAGAQADLHPAVAAGVVRVTGRADQCRARLTALQEWARAVSR